MEKSELRRQVDPILDHFAFQNEWVDYILNHFGSQEAPRRVSGGSEEAPRLSQENPGEAQEVPEEA
jgi:hypothetical protein